jgi:osmotically-inducible protein OsmY
LKETAMTADNELQQNVLDELRDEPSLDAAHIGVAADKGVVTLTGSVSSYAEKLIAEDAAKRVFGVRAVANDVQVQLRDGHKRTDTEIAKAAIDALRWHSMVPDEWIKVTVEKGWVTLEGTVDWKYQKDAADHAVRHLTGVKAVTNAIAVKPTAPLKVGEVKHRIFEAFRRNAELEARRIGIDAHENKVVLHGNVHDWSEVQEAQRAAWSAPGVAEVENRLVVVP